MMNCNDLAPYLVVEVLVDLGEVVYVSLVDALLVVQSLSLEVQLGQILKVWTKKYVFTLHICYMTRGIK